LPSRGWSLLKTAYAVLALSLVAAVHVTAGWLVTPDDGNLVFLWPVSGYVTMTLARRPGWPGRAALLAVPLLAVAALLTLYRGSWQAGVIPPSAYALECLLSVLAYDRLGDSTQLLRSARCFLRFFVWAMVLPCAAAGVLGAGLAHLVNDQPWAISAFLWARVDLYGMIISAVVVLGLRDVPLRLELGRGELRRSLPAALACVLLASAAVAARSFPFLVMPGMLLVAFGGSITVTAVTLAVISVIMLLGGPVVEDSFHLIQALSPTARIVLLQTFVTLLTLTTLTVAVALEDRRRISDAHERAKAELARTNRFLQSILESAGIGIIARDADFRVQAFNPAAEQIFGLARADVLGRDDLLPGPGGSVAATAAAETGRPAVDSYRQIATQVAATGRLEEEAELVRSDGRRFPAQLTVSLVRDAEGRPAGYVSLVQDITSRRAQERQVRELIERLRAAREEAEAANAAKSEFLAAMSHEIRTPLNGVLGFAELMLNSSLTDEQRQYVTLQREAGQSLLALVNDILDYSRIEAGRIEIDRQPFDLHRLVRDSVDFVTQSATAKGLAISVALAPEVPKVAEGDDLRIRQILLNLLTNAIKFTEQGSIRLAVTGGGQGAGEPVRFAITDTGIGIAEDKLSLLFQRFSQTDRSTTRRYGGSGLGLAICKRLVLLMGGEIGVETRLGEGSTFWFELPLPASDAVPVSGTDGAPAAPVKPGRILVVEDVEMNRVLARAVLSAAGHEVLMADNGVEAVALVGCEPVDVVLMDVQMPVMDGIDAARAIRALPPPVGRVPIVALTATAQDSEIRKCRAAGMNDHVTKPFTPAGLLQAVDRWIANGQMGEGAMSAEMLNMAQIEALESSLGRDQMSGLIQTFARDIRDRMGRLDAAAPGPDLRREAHAITSLVGNLGLDQACATSRALMNSATGPDMAELTARLRELHDQVEQGLGELARRYPGAA
jgi:PAS domain S-box-containing protein